MKRLHLDKIASVTARLALDRNAVVSDNIPAEAGTVIACRVLNAKRAYNTLEDVHGRKLALHPGDVIAGALGHRNALYGYSGVVPDEVHVGDELQLLNLGGVIGTGAEPCPSHGEPFQLQVLGSVLEFPYLATRVGVPANIQRGALPGGAMPDAADLPPLVVLVGTCMDAGKTTAAAALIHQWSHGGLRVAAGKLTGVSLRRDVLEMRDCGAEPVGLFTDFGVVTTDESNAVAAAHGLVRHLSESQPDRIVLEMGDGLLGTYGVRALLSDPALSAAIQATIVCAQDPVGAQGAQRILREEYGLETDVLSGRVTDTPVGLAFCRDELGVPAWNALRHGAQLAETVSSAISNRTAAALPSGSARAVARVSGAAGVSKGSDA